MPAVRLTKLLSSQKKWAMYVNNHFSCVVIALANLFFFFFFFFQQTGFLPPQFTQFPQFPEFPQAQASFMNTEYNTEKRIQDLEETIQMLTNFLFHLTGGQFFTPNMQ